MLQVTYKAIHTLTPYENNSRTHSEDQIKQIVASVREFGFTNPILIDENQCIIAGHGRLLAAELLGIDEVPTITLEGLSETQKAAYVIADNKLALNAGWNMELLGIEIEKLKGMDFNIELLGFELEELQILDGEGDEPNLLKPKEFSADDFSDFANKCPRCNFEYD
jgi:ParB family chromosome partitioning protein